MSMKHQRGVALMIVLMIVALVAVIATEMGMRLQLQMQRTVNIKDNNQAYWYALGAEEYARKSIALLMDEHRDKINLNQTWSDEFTFPLEGGGIQAQLEDLQSCFNLNALPGANETELNEQSVTPIMDAFARMLSAANEDLDSFTIETIRDSLADWIDQDDQMRPYGAEDSEYSSREFPYLAANAMLASQSELRLINGIDPVVMDTILPLICVIPGSDRMSINVNTLNEDNAALLAGLTGMSLSQATNLINTRPSDGWDDAAAFLAEPSVNNDQMTESQRQWFTVSTEYFILHTKTRYNNATFAMSSVFSAKQNEPIAVVRREFGESK